MTAKKFIENHWSEPTFNRVSIHELGLARIVHQWNSFMMK